MASRAVAVRPPSGAHTFWRSTTRFARTWPYLIPALVFFVGWQLLPIIRALWISFTNYSFLLDDSPESAKWIGFENYVNALHDPLVRTGLWHAAIFTAIFLPGMVFLPMVIAVLVDRVRNQKIASDLPADPAAPGDDPRPADLHPLGVDVLERNRADQLLPRRRSPRLRPPEPADLARLDEHHLHLAWR